MKKSSFKIAGFTLAEVLITLTVIGVIAALTIPSLITNIQDSQFKTAWRRVYSNAAQAYKLAVNDNGGVGFGDYGATPYNGNTKFNAFKSKLSVIKSCDGNAFGNCWAPNGVGPESLNISYCLTNSYQSNNRAFMTNDGVSWMLCSDSYAIFAIDVNGPKPPNQWGKDVFQIYVQDTGIKPSSEEITYNSRKYLYQ